MPERNQTGGAKIVDVSAGDDFAIALDANGRVYGFGEASRGTLGV